MPLPGATSAKVGQRYEDRWTAHCALKVLKGEAQWIYLEPVDTDETGFEFDLATSDGVESHQVKRQVSLDGGWRLSQLTQVLRAFGNRLNEPTSRCVFASGNAAQTLDDLSEDARNAEDWDTFDRGVLQHQTRKRHFDDVRETWAVSEQETLEKLKRVRVATIGESELVDLLASECELLLEGPIETAPEQLIGILRDRVNRRIDATELWNALAAAGIRPNPWKHKPELTTRVRSVNNRFINSRIGTLIRGQLLERPEVGEICAALHTSSVLFVEGEAGVGKSDVLLGLVRRLDGDGVSHLTFRLDRWQPTDDPTTLGKEMGLPASPVTALELLANGRPSVLIIDQLDVVSTTSGRHAEFLDCVTQMIRAAATHAGMTVVLACRTFDAQNDARLRQIHSSSPKVRVKHLPSDALDAVLEDMGLQPNTVDAKLKILLQVPLHLWIFSQINPDIGSGRPSLQTRRDLYDEFWKEKRTATSRRLGRDPDWIDVLRTLAEHMSENAVLRAPKELLDEWEADVVVMLSESVLVEDGGQVAFLHETFFDYCFARIFFAKRQTVRDLLSHDQLLFRRAQVRQLLDYERQGDFERYVADLRHLLLDADIRFHIKDLVLSWLATVEDPRLEEWRVVEQLLRDPSSSLSYRAESTICHAQWFILLDNLGLVEKWLADESVADLALRIINAGHSVAPNRAVELVSNHRKVSDNAAASVASSLDRMNISESRPTFELLVELLDGDDPNLGSRDPFLIAHDLEKHHPDWACEFVGVYLRNRLRAADELGLKNPFEYGGSVIPHQIYARDLVVESARTDPEAFLSHVLPVMLAIIERTAYTLSRGSADEPVRDAVWHRSDVGLARQGLDEALFDAADVALASVASDAPGRFLEVLDENRHTEFETVCALLFKGFRANPETLADAAAEFLLANPLRLNVGRSADGHWATRQVLQAIAPHCSSDLYNRLEIAVLNHYTWWEHTKEGRNQRGFAQFTLLTGMDPERQSDLARQRLGEWQRKFNALAPDRPVGAQFGVVGSPIAEDATQKMTDAQWLSAFSRYNSDESRHADFLKGGAHELSQQLRTRAEEDPVRFARLVDQLPDTARVCYFDAILQGVANSKLDVPLETTRSLLIRCHALPDRPCGRWIADPLRRHIGEPLPTDLAIILGWYAANDPDPASISSDFSGEESAERRIDMQGLNSVRGSIAYSIAPHLHRHAENVNTLSPTIDHLVTDSAVAVRAMAVRALTAVLRHDPDRAIEWFLRLSNHPDDLVFAGREMHLFLLHAASRRFDDLNPVLDRMIASELPAVRTRGAVAASLAALDDREAETLTERCAQADAACRLGLAKVNAANIAVSAYRSQCERQLAFLFDDEDVEVRAAASEVFRVVARENFARSEWLVDTFLNSRAFDFDGMKTLLNYLTTADSPPPNIALRVCNSFLDAKHSDDVRDFDVAIHDAGELAIRAYADAAGDTSDQNAALDAIDRVLELDLFRMSSALAEYER